MTRYIDFCEDEDFATPEGVPVERKTHRGLGWLAFVVAVVAIVVLTGCANVTTWLCEDPCHPQAVTAAPAKAFELPDITLPSIDLCQAEKDMWAFLAKLNPNRRCFPEQPADEVK